MGYTVAKKCKIYYCDYFYNNVLFNICCLTMNKIQFSYFFPITALVNLAM